MAQFWQRKCIVLHIFVLVIYLTQGLLFVSSKNTVRVILLTLSAPPNPDVKEMLRNFMNSFQSCYILRKNTTSKNVANFEIHETQGHFCDTTFTLA